MTFSYLSTKHLSMFFLKLLKIATFPIPCPMYASSFHEFYSA